MEKKICKKCNTEKEIGDFGLLDTGRINSWCKNCYNEYVKLRMRKHRKEHPENHKRSRRKYYDKIVNAVFSHYGNKCSNCGCPNISSKAFTSNRFLKDKIYIDRKFLELNHIKGEGYLDRGLKSNLQVCIELVKGIRSWEDYNLLCRVCNILHYVQTVLKINGHKITYSSIEL